MQRYTDQGTQGTQNQSCPSKSSINLKHGQFTAAFQLFLEGQKNYAIKSCIQNASRVIANRSPPNIPKDVHLY